MDTEDPAHEWRRRYNESIAAEEKSLEARGLGGRPAIAPRFIGGTIFFVGGWLYLMTTSGNPWLFAVAVFVLLLVVLGGLAALRVWTVKRRSHAND